MKLLEERIKKDGVIKETSDASLMEKIEKEGYEWV